MTLFNTLKFNTVYRVVCIPRFRTYTSGFIVPIALDTTFDWYIKNPVYTCFEYQYGNYSIAPWEESVIMEGIRQKVIVETNETIKMLPLIKLLYV